MFTLYTVKLKKREKINKYASEYKEQDNTHFEPFVIESGRVFGECAKNVFLKSATLSPNKRDRADQTLHISRNQDFL